MSIARRILASAIVAASATHAAAANLIFDSSPPAITTPVTADTSFWIGENAGGVSVSISAGGSVTVNTGGNSATLGVNASSSGNSLTVSGSPSGLTVGETLNIGYYGAKNSLTVGSGGTVNAKDIWFGGFAGSTGNTATVTGTGTLTATGSLIIGYGAGSNALNLLAGGAATTAAPTIGLVAGAPGNTITVSGAGSLWSVTDVVYIGFTSSNNQLTVSSGGQVTSGSSDFLIGAEVGADDNQMLVTGAGSSFSKSGGTVYVGRNGRRNSLEIRDGATASTPTIRIGGGSGSSSTSSPPGESEIVVDGAGSSLAITGELRVGAGTAGTGSFAQITNGGVVTVTVGTVVGRDATADDNLLIIDGAGSSLTTPSLTIGRLAGSTGNSARLSNGGTLTAAAIAIGEQSGLIIGGKNSSSGSITSPTTITGTEAGAYVRFSHTDASYTFPSTLAGTLRVIHNGKGTTILSGPATYTGTTTVSAGILQFDTTNLSTGVTVEGGTLRGTGTVGAVTLAGAGRLAPGASPGILSTGNLSMPAGTFYDVEINGATVGSGYDQANVTGTVSLGGTLVATLGYQPTIGTSYTIIANDGSDAVSGTFGGLPEGSTVTVGDVIFQVSYVGGTGNDVVLTATGYVPATPVPAHTPLGLALLALLMLGGGMARSRKSS